MSFKVKTHYAPWEDSLQFVVAEERLGDTAYLMPGEWRVIERHAPLEAEVWRMPIDRARAMLNAFAEAAWKEGWRPEGYTTADTNAMKAHLEDMRRLVFEGKLFEAKT